MRKVVLALTLAALPLAIAETPLAAQGAGTTMGQVQIVKPMPGHRTAFVEGVQEQIDVYTSTGGAWSWAVFDIVMGPRTGQFVFYTGGHTYADFDAPDGDQERLQESFEENIEPHVEAYTSALVRVRPEYSLTPPDAPVRPIYEVITVWSSGPEGDVQLMHFFEKAKKSFEDQGAPIEYTVFQGAQGSDPGQWVVSIPHESFAAMDGPAATMEDMFAPALGEFEARELVDLFGEATSRATSEVFVLREDLSLNLPN